jgi:hypothetical protein
MAVELDVKIIQQWGEDSPGDSAHAPRFYDQPPDRPRAAAGHLQSGERRSHFRGQLRRPAQKTHELPPGIPESQLEHQVTPPVALPVHTPLPGQRDQVLFVEAALRTKPRGVGMLRRIVEVDVSHSFCQCPL